MPKKLDKHKIYIVFFKDRSIDEYCIYGCYIHEISAEKALKLASQKGYGGLFIMPQDLEGDLECIQSGSHFTDLELETNYESTSPIMLYNRSHKSSRRVKRALNIF